MTDLSLAIIGGNGDLPDILAAAHPQALSVRIGKNGVRIGELGDVLIRLRDAGVTHICMGGSIERPNLLSLMPSAETAKLFVKYGFSFKGGDDSLLRRLRGVLELEGFQVVGAHTLCPDLLAPEGVLTQSQPIGENLSAYMDWTRAYGQEDKGQGIVVAGGAIIDREDKSGTNALIERNAGKGAILVKAAKPQQDLDLDMPTVGVQTVANAAAAGFRGIVVEAGRTLLLHRDLCVRDADKAGLFLAGVK